jgi:hypothetical protein
MVSWTMVSWTAPGTDSLDGDCDGVIDGSLEGACDGMVDGNCQGNWEGIMDGSLERQSHCPFES